MIRLVTLLFVVFSFSLLGQRNEYMVWTEIGVKGKIKKPLGWSLELNNRFGKNGLETFFPQVAIDYDVTKWLETSLKYRLVYDKNKVGNYERGHRIDFNLEAEKTYKKRLTLGFRTRYQYAFEAVDRENYDADIDQAFRFKPSVEYDIDNFVLSPTLSSEFFLDPSYGPNSPGFSKYRINAGFKLDIKSPHKISMSYQLDKAFRDYKSGQRHTLSLSYSYKI